MRFHIKSRESKGAIAPLAAEQPQVKLVHAPTEERYLAAWGIKNIADAALKRDEIEEAQKYYTLASQELEAIKAALRNQVFVIHPDNYEETLAEMTDQNSGVFFRYIEAITNLSDMQMKVEQYPEAELNIKEFLQLAKLTQDFKANDLYNLAAIYKMQYEQNQDIQTLRESTSCFISALIEYREAIKKNEATPEDCVDVSKEIIDNLSRIASHENNHQFVFDGLSHEEQQILTTIVAEVLKEKHLQSMVGSIDKSLDYFVAVKWECPLRHPKGWSKEDYDKIRKLQSRLIPDTKDEWRQKTPRKQQKKKGIQTPKRKGSSPDVTQKQSTPQTKPTGEKRSKTEPNALQHVDIDLVDQDGRVKIGIDLVPDAQNFGLFDWNAADKDLFGLLNAPANSNAPQANSNAADVNADQSPEQLTESENEEERASKQGSASDSSNNNARSILLTERVLNKPSSPVADNNVPLYNIGIVGGNNMKNIDEVVKQAIKSSSKKKKTVVYPSHASRVTAVKSTNSEGTAPSKNKFNGLQPWTPAKTSFTGIKHKLSLTAPESIGDAKHTRAARISTPRKDSPIHNDAAKGVFTPENSSSGSVQQRKKRERSEEAPQVTPGAAKTTANIPDESPGVAKLAKVSDDSAPSVAPAPTPAPAPQAEKAKKPDAVNTYTILMQLLGNPGQDKALVKGTEALMQKAQTLMQEAEALDLEAQAEEERARIARVEDKKLQAEAYRIEPALAAAEAELAEEKQTAIQTFLENMTQGVEAKKREVEAKKREREEAEKSKAEKAQSLAAKKEKLAKTNQLLETVHHFKP